ncbi:MAG: methylated-DNA--[protein]-cysteine S-methyltransferase [Promethearchaeota archaeon]
MTTNTLATCIKSESLKAYILITFKCPKDSKEEIILHEIKFFKGKRELIGHINDNEYLFFENKGDIQQDKIKNSIDLIEDYLSGKPINLFDEFNRLNVSLTLEQKFSTPFSLKVIQSLVKLKYGEITSYSTLGDEIGSKAYRAIGSVMKKNPIPLIIPCHRVIKKNGKTGGFMGIIDNSWEIGIKQHLISMESICIK